MSAAGATRPRLRPLSLGEILDVSIKICQRNWRTLLRAVLVVVVPVQVVRALLTSDYTARTSGFGTRSTETAQQSLHDVDRYLGGLAISTLLQLLAVLLASAACLRAIALAYLGEPTDWRSSLSYAMRRFGPLLWVSILYVLALLGGFVLLFLPMIWLYVALAFGMPVLLVEGIHGRRALGRSHRLVTGRWWRTFGILLFGFVLVTVISAIVQAIFYVGVFVGPDNDALDIVLTAIAGVVGLAIGTPFQAALTTVLYFDLRVRKEGYDLELLASEIGAAGPPDADEPLRLPGVPSG